MCAVAGLMAAGLLVFPVPTFLPGQYWLWHSIWHLVMFQGYWCASTLRMRERAWKVTYGLLRHSTYQV